MKNPLVHGKEGYRAYDHTALQLEDYIDFMHALYSEYDTIWLFDHSCGHDRGRTDGL